MATYKSVNTNLAPLFKGALPKFQYGFRHLARPQTCQAILDKLDLKSKYPEGGKVDVVDVFTGYGLFSTMLNNELKPRNHVIVESNKVNVGLWMDRISHLEKETGNSENFRLYPHDGYKWETFETMINEKVITPDTQLPSKIHDELLIIGNITPTKFGESLFAQWIMCCIYKNWLQKYGRVRMLCFVPEVTAMKFMSGAGHTKRNKSLVKRELYTDSHLIAMTTPSELTEADGQGYDPRLVVADQPIPLFSNDVFPANGQMALLEIIPRDLSSENFDLFEYIIRSLYYGALNKLKHAINNVGPGAVDDLCPQFSPELLEKSAKELTIEDWKVIFDVYEKWPFKPTWVETLDIVHEES